MSSTRNPRIRLIKINNITKIAENVLYLELEEALVETMQQTINIKVETDIPLENTTGKFFLQTEHQNSLYASPSPDPNPLYQNMQLVKELEVTKGYSLFSWPWSKSGSPSVEYAIISSCKFLLASIHGTYKVPSVGNHRPSYASIRSASGSIGSGSITSKSTETSHPLS